MSSVLDSSVVLALLRNEGAAKAFQHLVQDAWLSSVSLVEILSRIEDLGVGGPSHANEVLGLFAGVQPFTESQARIAASLRRSTQSAGLSLGDRACLALAIELGVDVYTADRAWAKVELPCRVHLVR